MNPDHATRSFHDGELIPGSRYRVLSLLGQGGMGAVYEVEHVELGRVFVLKALHQSLKHREDLVRRLRTEWRSLGQLDHPAIVQVTDAGVAADGTPFFVMERLEGETLSSRMKRDRVFSESAAITVACGILEGLGAAHCIGVIHRDVKPPNVFLCRGGDVKLLDFGVAKVLSARDKAITARGVAVGTPRYMSPEQAQGAKVDGRADLYAVGLLLYEMLTGASPFQEARDNNEMVLAHLLKIAPRVRDSAPQVSVELDQLVAELLSKAPSQRPSSAEQVVVRLKGLLARRRPSSEFPAAPSSRSQRGGAVEASSRPGWGNDWSESSRSRSALGAVGGPKAAAQASLARSLDGPRATVRSGSGDMVADGYAPFTPLSDPAMTPHAEYVSAGYAPSPHRAVPEADSQAGTRPAFGHHAHAAHGPQYWGGREDGGRAAGLPEDTIVEPFVEAVPVDDATAGLADPAYGPRGTLLIRSESLVAELETKTSSPLPANEEGDTLAPLTPPGAVASSRRWRVMMPLALAAGASLAALSVLAWGLLGPRPAAQVVAGEASAAAPGEAAAASVQPRLSAASADSDAAPELAQGDTRPEVSVAPSASGAMAVPPVASSPTRMETTQPSTSTTGQKLSATGATASASQATAAAPARSSVKPPATTAPRTTSTARAAGAPRAAAAATPASSPPKHRLPSSGL